MGCFSTNNRKPDIPILGGDLNLATTGSGPQWWRQVCHTCIYYTPSNGPKDGGGVNEMRKKVTEQLLMRLLGITPYAAFLPLGSRFSFKSSSCPPLFKLAAFVSGKASAQSGKTVACPPQINRNVTYLHY